MNYSPLRYPGGKAKLSYYIKNLLESNNLSKYSYAEGFAGGSGLALELLFSETVEKVYLNDNDRSIWAFWYSVLYFTDALIELINCSKVDIDNWHIQKQVFKNKESADILELGFATLFLNRTNRSGILKANPIGGLSQEGDYKIDCRFNKKKIISQIRAIGLMRDRIVITNEDAIDFITRLDNDQNNILFYLDPPYVMKGHQLYNNSFKKEDHETLRNVIVSIKNHWFVTYDDCSLVEELYADSQQRKFTLNYSVSTKRKGTEIAVYDNRILIIPEFKK